MNRRPPKARAKKTRHGAALDAPSEFGFVMSDSPAPGPVGPRPARAQSVPDGPGPLALVWSGIKLSIGLVVVASISVAIAWAARQYALSTPRFAITELDVRGNRHHSGDQLARIAGVGRGQNLFSLDTTAVERKLLESPWVKQAKVGRKLPGTLRIDVVEREAVASAVLDGVLHLVTPEGEPFKPVEARDPSDLPVLTGVTLRDFAVDRARAMDRLEVGLSVLRDYQGMPAARTFEAEEVHLSPEGTVDLVVGQRGITLKLGRGPFRQRLLMAARILGKLQAEGQLPGIVFLDNEAHPERVVVRMR